MTSIGERIRQARKSAGFTQASLAEKSGVAAISIHQYESGKRQPRMEQLRRISDALGIPIESLISERVEMIPGRSWVTITDAPYSEDYMMNIEAIDKEAFEATIQLFGGEKILTYTVENRINSALHRLSPKGLLIAMERLEELARIPEYCREDSQ